MPAEEPAAAPPESRAAVERPQRGSAWHLLRRPPPWLVGALLLVAGGIVFFPAILTPRFLDDYFQTSMVEGTFPAARGPLELYDFVGDNDRRVLLDRGLLPWWSHPRLTVRFLRPLSSLLRYGDHHLLGNRALPAHLHSFAWWAAAALAAYALYRRALSRRAALLAAFVFALAPCHAVPLAWTSNREALVSLTFGILGLAALLRYRERGRPLQAGAAALCFCLALLGGEYAAAFGGYALALALVGHRSTRLRRLVGLLCFGAPASIYLGVRAALGYGTMGSGFYVDPFRDPRVFLEHAPRRLVTLLGDAWFGVGPETVNLATPGWVLGLLAVVGLALLVVPLRRAFAQLEGARREHATWLLLGSLLSLTPMLAVQCAPRLLGASLVGVAATIGLLLDSAWFPSTTAPRGAQSALVGVVALGLGFTHLIHSPVTSRLTCSIWRQQALAFIDRAAALRAHVGEPSKREIVVVGSFDSTAFTLPYSLDDEGTPPERWRVLSLAPHVLMIRRDARTLELTTPPDQSLYPTGEGNHFRDENTPFAPGDVVRVRGLQVTVLEVGAQGPWRALFEFDDPLESPSRAWLVDTLAGIRAAPPPPIGFGSQLDVWPLPFGR
jgi:hypothetical protein